MRPVGTTKYKQNINFPEIANEYGSDSTPNGRGGYYSITALSALLLCLTDERYKEFWTPPKKNVMSEYIEKKINKPIERPWLKIRREIFKREEIPHMKKLENPTELIQYLIDQDRRPNESNCHMSLRLGFSVNNFLTNNPSKDVKCSSLLRMLDRAGLELYVMERKDIQEWQEQQDKQEK